MNNRTKRWWTDNPMTYGNDHGKLVYGPSSRTPTVVEFGTPDFFEAADRVFYSWNQELHTSKGKFAGLFPYEELIGKQVLEIGCGMGCMAMNWARNGAEICATDLNPVAVEQTRRRFEVFALTGNILQADGEHLPFRDETFDYAYSWGVLHHTPGIKTAFQEMFRVLKTQARFGVMLYHRHSLLHQYLTEWIEGFLHLENHFLSPLELASRYSDGGRQEGNPHTWPVTKQEVLTELSTLGTNVRIRTLGNDIPIILNDIAPKLGEILPGFLTRALARRWGWSLWITGEKA